MWKIKPQLLCFQLKPTVKPGDKAIGAEFIKHTAEVLSLVIKVF